MVVRPRIVDVKGLSVCDLHQGIVGSRLGVITVCGALRESIEIQAGHDIGLPPFNGRWHRENLREPCALGIPTVLENPNVAEVGV